MPSTAFRHGVGTGLVKQASQQIMEGKKSSEMTLNVSILVKIRALRDVGEVSTS